MTFIWCAHTCIHTYVVLPCTYTTAETCMWQFPVLLSALWEHVIKLSNYYCSVGATTTSHVDDYNGDNSSKQQQHQYYNNNNNNKKQLSCGAVGDKTYSLSNKTNNQTALDVPSMCSGAAGGVQIIDCSCYYYCICSRGSWSSTFWNQSSLVI